MFYPNKIIVWGVCVCVKWVGSEVRSKLMIFYPLCRCDHLINMPYHNATPLNLYSAVQNVSDNSTMAGRAEVNRLQSKNNL